jgi:SAM-dependent methyltransferase
MQASDIDPGEFRSGQRKQWDGAAPGWIKWSELTDTAAGGVCTRLVEMADVEAASRVLDVACGYGEPALTAARAAEPGGSVVATDISAEMLARGRERAAAEGVDNIEFVESAAIALDFPEDSFDAAVSRWGIIFDPDGEGAAARVRSLLKEGGKFAIASWGQLDEVPFLGLAMKTIVGRLDVTPPPAGTPGPLSRPTEDALAGLLSGGGFGDVGAERMTVTFTYDSPEDYTTFIREIAPPVSALLAPFPEDVQTETWAAITAAAADRASADGSVSLDNVVILAAGRA